MKKEDIHLQDWERFLIGNNPWGFMLEVFLRTLIIYVCLVVIMRLLGKRMHAQLTITELAVMLTLGAIVSVPMQVPSKGIFPGIILLISILLLHQGLTLLSYKYRKIEVFTEGKVTLLIKNGIIDIKELNKLLISKELIFSKLRSQNIHHLGEVQRVYSEADGHFSVFRFKDAKPGLSVLPGYENIIPVGNKVMKNIVACCYCGNTIKNSDHKLPPCSNCAHNEWSPAIH